MSQASNTPPAYDVAAQSRRAGVIVAGRSGGGASHAADTRDLCGQLVEPRVRLRGQALFELAALGARWRSGRHRSHADQRPVTRRSQRLSRSWLRLSSPAPGSWRSTTGGARPARHAAIWTNQQLIKSIAIVAAVAATIAALRLLAGRLGDASGLAGLGAQRRLSRSLVSISPSASWSSPLPAASVGCRRLCRTGHHLLGAFALLWSLPWGGALVLTRLARRDRWPSRSPSPLRSVPCRRTRTMPSSMSTGNWVVLLVGLRLGPARGRSALGERGTGTGRRPDGSPRASLGERTLREACRHSEPSASMLNVVDSARAEN